MLRLIDRVWSPDRFKDCPMREDAAGMLSEEHEQLEFLRGQPNPFVATGHVMTVAIDDKIATNDRTGSGWRRIHSSQRHANPCEQFLGSEGFCHVVVGTGV